MGCSFIKINNIYKMAKSNSGSLFIIDNLNLHFSAKFNRYDEAKDLLDNNYDPNYQDNRDKTPLHVAVKTLNIELHALSCI